ncbi:diguanylate cyclase [Magnetococcales bacterium HHB-1]
MKVFSTMQGGAYASSRQLGLLYKDQEIIYRQGSQADCMFSIQQGEVELVLQIGDEIHHLTRYKAGETFGEISLFAKKSRFATARAKGDCHVIRLDHQSFIRELHVNPSLAFHILEKLANRVVELDDAFVDYGLLGHKIQKDHLTGLPKFSEPEDLLVGEVKRAKRLSKSLSYIIVEIDHYKGLRKKYGKKGVKQVIKNLSVLLQHHFRKTDIIGRYGRECFPVILFEAKGEHAKRIMETVLKEFIQLEHETERGTFNATFSCGLAVFPDCSLAEDLRSSAHKALKTVREQGGNGVVWAQNSPATAKQNMECEKGAQTLPILDHRAYWAALVRRLIHRRRRFFTPNKAPQASLPPLGAD